MKIKITLTAQPGLDSASEIREEINVLQDILGTQLAEGAVQKEAVYEGEFHEFYIKVKERIMRKIKAFE